MGKLDPMGIVGRVNNIIHYRVGENYYVRSAPRKYKQTKATKASASLFGRASRITSILYGQLLSIMPDSTDRKTRGRLVAAVFQWFNNSGGLKAEKGKIEELTGFSFSETKKPISTIWKGSLQVNHPVSGGVELVIPAFVPTTSMKAPKGTSSVICKIASGVCSLSDDTDLGSFSTEFKFDYNDKPIDTQTISINLSTPRKSLVVTAVFIEYLITKKRHTAVNKNTEFMPSEIVDARYTGF
jgi:hypothetical protein